MLEGGFLHELRCGGCVGVSAQWIGVDGLWNRQRVVGSEDAAGGAGVVDKTGSDGGSLSVSAACEVDVIKVARGL